MRLMTRWSTKVNLPSSAWRDTNSWLLSLLLRSEALGLEVTCNENGQIIGGILKLFPVPGITGTILGEQARDVVDLEPEKSKNQAAPAPAQ